MFGDRRNKSAPAQPPEGQDIEIDVSGAEVHMGINRTGDDQVTVRLKIESGRTNLDLNLHFTNAKRDELIERLAAA